MNNIKTELYAELFETVATKKYPLQYEEFGGANVIVSAQPGRTGWEGDLVVCHPEAGSLAWLVYGLKDVYFDVLDAGNKYDFFERIGRCMEEGLARGLTVHEVLLYTLGCFRPGSWE
jgi:hypothetical protein